VAGKPCTITPWLKTWYEEAGFVDVHEEIFRIPTCGWPDDPEEKGIGTWMEEMLNGGIDGILRAYQLRVAGLTMEQHQVRARPDPISGAFPSFSPPGDSSALYNETTNL
jgi:metalloendopeptidase OMA1, mitochondrial